MSDRSTIEWTNATWNPVRGCTRISPGCAHCYAETFAERFSGVADHPFERGFDLRLVPTALDLPLRWKAGRLIPDLDLRRIDWVIVGGESGGKCRPMNADWVRQIRDRCRRAGVPFFFRQWGRFPKKKNGRQLDGRTWDEMPRVGASP